MNASVAEKRPAVELTREQAHAKVDEVFDALEEIAAEKGYPYVLQRIMVQATPTGKMQGCVLVERASADKRMWGPYVTWGFSPNDIGLHSGHYDLHEPEAIVDWLDRVRRGW